jgi:ferric-dicitrate binding protein FerR (iron transport regulator)
VRLVSATEIHLDEGAVYVDSDDDHPAAAVAVHTRLGLVRERGTQFEVRLARQVLRVRVREGRVALDQGGAREEGSRGQELRLEDGRLVRGVVATHGPEWAWVQQIAPPFEIEGASLGRFVRWVSREAGRPVRLAGDDASIRLHGSIAGLDPEEALRAVLPTCGRTHWYSNGEIVVGRVSGERREGGRVP